MPDHGRAPEQLIRIHLKHGRIKESIDTLERWLVGRSFDDTRTRHSSDLLMREIGRVLWNRHHFGEFEERLIQLETTHSYWPEAWRRGMACYLGGDLSGAAEHVEAVIREYPGWLIASGLITAIRGRMSPSSTTRQDLLASMSAVKEGPISGFYLGSGRSPNDDEATISLLMPTRGRPGGAAALIESAYSTAHRPGLVEIVLYLDSDDPTRHAYEARLRELSQKFSEGRIALLVGPRIALSREWNLTARASAGTILMLANDDLVFASLGWDASLRSSVSNVPDDIYCAWFNEGRDNHDYGDFPIFSRRMVEALGYFTPEFLLFQCNDQWIWDVAARLGRLRYLKNSTVEHQRKWLDGTDNMPKPEYERRLEHSRSDSFLF